VNCSCERKTIKGKKEKDKFSPFHEVRNTLHGPSPASAIDGVLIALDLEACSELHTFQVYKALIGEDNINKETRFWRLVDI